MKKNLISALNKDARGEKIDVYQLITDRIIDQLEAGVVPWRKPWTGDANGAYNYMTGRRYSLLNQMLLQHEDAYLTWNQIKAMGGIVKKGAHAEKVVFWKRYPVKEKDPDTGEEKAKIIPLLRYYNVFWVGDVENIDKRGLEDQKKKKSLDPVGDAEIIIDYYMNSENHPAFYRDRASRKAFYDPIMDAVTVPNIGQYNEIEMYYSTCFHELIHSTGAASRLNRNIMNHFGTQEYSKEELVAEIGAAMLVNIAGLETSKSFNNSAAYIKSWLQVLRNDKKMIVSASAQARKAVGYITGQPIGSEAETGSEETAAA